MPAFFVPDTPAEQQEQIYEAIVKGAEDHRDMGRRVLPRRIFRLRYVHNGGELVAEVGKEEPRERQTVMAILDHGDVFTIRMRIRGFLKIGEPMMVGPSSVRELVEFD